MIYRLIGVSMKDIKSSSGKKIGEMSIIDNSYVIDNFYKPEIVSICKDVINNTNKKCDKLYGSHANCEQVPRTDNSGHYKSSLIYSETPTKSC